ncbi:hypothetical protein X753_21795 [Mesorhizobium sp. LNJC399B00]|uniref:hypothetical protein n=1 Tax=unclassified Mesorhizobium TaxID=325217 RepID=UPI0003CE947B|nr:MULTISPECIES: hypothetical protein [unclassified Mesorhizobium]ESY03910.1 hypothetical protein X753_21795 [Mesorhizobium sp. LNJC399B00]WJI68957.1 hypothetical protein NLY36_29985 [Mesorhizobium sp. C399B]
MIDICRERLCHFNNAYVHELKDTCDITETSPGGEGTARFSSKSPIIRIKSSKQPPLLWSLKQRKCADGAFLTFVDNEVWLHIVELKSGLSLSDWAHAKKQFEGMYLTAVAVAGLLCESNVAHVTCYIAYTSDNLAATRGASPTLLKTLVGSTKTLGGWEEWTNGEISLPFNVTASVVKGKRAKGGDVDFGAV